MVLTTKVIRDNIMVLPCESDEKSVGGIYVPDSLKERSAKAKLVTIGNGVKGKPLEFPEGIGVGDYVCHIKDAGVEVVEDGVSYFIMKHQDVLAYIKN